MTPPRICMVGSSMMDLIARVPRLPRKAETIAGSEFHMGFGGKGSNQAVMAARLGGDVAVVVKLGRDAFGEDTLANYREQGIDVTHVGFDDTRFSGVAPIAVDESTGDNMVIIVPGANDTLGVDDVERAADAITAADVLLCQLETPIEATQRAFEIAREGGGTRTVLNPAPAAEVPHALWRLTDVFVPNEVEAGYYVGWSVQSPEQAEQAARELVERGPEVVLVTLGDRGAVGIDRDARAIRVETEHVRAVDSTGAGDAFVGSLGYLLAAGEQLENAARKACAIATRSVMKNGTQTSFPYRHEVRDLLEQ